jgi:hypothetical protein
VRLQRRAQSASGQQDRNRGAERAGAEDNPTTAPTELDRAARDGRHEAINDFC